MLLYHPKSTTPVECHPTQVEAMKKNGWTENKPAAKTPQTSKSQTKEQED